jgi:phospholipase C
MRNLAVRFGLLIGLTLVGCEKGDDLPRSNLSAQQAADARAACKFGAGTLPGLSLAHDVPLGTQIPIDTFVLVMMENRSFDHLLQNINSFGHRSDVEVAPADFSNPDWDEKTQQFTNQTVPIHHLSNQYCFDDTSHGWTDVHLEWDNGKMDRFVAQNYHNDSAPADGKRAMGYYTEAELPWFYTVANTFSLADHNFSSLLGPTFPNREFFYAATSFGHTGNEIITDPKPTIMQALQTAKVDWRIYKTSLPGMAIFIKTYQNYLENTLSLATFYNDAAAGMLGQVNFIDANLKEDKGALDDDFHPPSDVQVSQQFLHDVVRAVINSPQWPHTAIIITFDEHGGIYDHVPPPPACAPDDIAPMYNGTDNFPGDFKRYGIRVPLIVISPYSKPSYVSHVVYDHTSILRLLEARFGMPALTARDANADPLLDLFDFSKPSMLNPPALAQPPTDATQLANCQALYPDTSGGAPVPDMGMPVDSATD